MSKINSTKKIILEEFPAEVQGWLKKLIEPLNRFLEQVYFALVNGLTLADNLKSQTNGVVIAVGQVYPIKIAWNKNERPTMVVVAQITESTGGAVVPYALSWIFDNGTVKLTFNGLNTAKKYNVKITGIV